MGGNLRFGEWPNVVIIVVRALAVVEPYVGAGEMGGH